MMTKKHFNAIAAAIREARSTANPDLIAAPALLSTLAAFFRTENRAFDTSRFYAACEIPSQPLRHRNGKVART